MSEDLFLWIAVVILVYAKCRVPAFIFGVALAAAAPIIWGWLPVSEPVSEPHRRVEG